MKKRWTKWLSLTFGLVLCMGLLVGMARAEGTADTFQYSIIKGVLTIKKTGALSPYASMSSAPWYNDRKAITSIVVDDSVTQIPFGYFSDFTNVREITVPFIGKGEGASTNDEYFLGYIFGQGLQYPNDFSGNYPNLKKVTLTGGTELHYPAFTGCINLTEIILPDTLTSIGYHAFGECDGLTQITIPDSVTSVGSNVFYGCDGLTQIAEMKGISYIPEYAYSDCKGLSEVVIPDNVQDIRKCAFYNCTNITEIQFPPNLQGIREHAFDGCAGLTEVVIPDSVQSIGIAAFIRCNNIAKLTIPFVGGSRNTGSNNFHIGYIIDGLQQNYLESFATNNPNLKTVTITDSEKIPASAFAHCKNLTEINLPDTLTSIGYYAFGECDGLTQITIPDSVTSVGDSIFAGCDGLTQIVEMKGISYIPGCTYSGCKGLTKLVFPENVTGIHTCAFQNCTNITEIQFPSNLKGISEHAFDGCTGLTEVVVPDSVQSIGIAAFIRCNNIAKLTIPFVGGSRNTGSNNFHIGYITDGLQQNYLESFATNNPNLKTVIITDAKEIPASAFYAAKQITEIQLPQELEKINASAFYGCEGLTDLEIPKSVTVFGYNVFYGCSNLTIHCYPDSAAEKHAIANSIPYVYLSDPTTPEVVPVTSVTLNKTALSLTTGDTETLTATVTPDNATNKTVTWTTSDASVATVSNGKVTAVGAGTATVTASADGKSATCAVTVTKPMSTYTVTYSANGGSGAMPARIVVGNETLTLPVCSFTAPSGKRFRAWSTGGKEYAAGTVFDVTADTAFTAVWEDVPAVSGAVIEVGAAKGRPGRTVDVPLTLCGNPGLTALQLKLSYDESALALTEIADGGLLAGKNHGKNLAKNPYTLDWNDDTAEENNTDDGVVVTLRFTVAEDASEGSYPITVTLSEAWDADLEPVSLAVQSGSVTVTHTMLGDVNGDGVVDGRDRMTLARYLADWDGYTIDEAAADVNEDGVVDGRDRMILARHLADWDGYETLPYRMN